MALGMIFIVFVILSFLCIFLMTCTNRANEILNKVNQRENRSFLRGIDFIELIKVIRIKNELNREDRSFLKNVLIICIISIMFFVVFAFLIYGTVW